MKRELDLCHDKEITTTMAVPCTVRTAVAGDIWSKIFEKTIVKTNCEKGLRF